MPRRFHFLAAVIAAILLAGCGGSDKKSGDVVELEETLGFSSEGIRERQSRVEDQIRDCMSAQGFEYTPADPSERQQALTGDARPGDEDFVKQYGYGISTLFGRASAESDPNEKVRKSLSTSDRATYDRALWGESIGASFADAVDSGDFSELGGCTKQASEAAFGGGAVLSELVEGLDQLDSAIVEDQRMVKARESWSACMSEKGFRYEDPDEIDTDLEKRFQAVVGVAVRRGAAAPPNPGTSYDPSALAELKREEVEIATADLDCEKREIDPAERVVRPQYEKTFRRENRTLLTRVRPLEK